MKKYIVIVLSGLLLVLSGCGIVNPSGQQGKSSYQKISVEEAKEMMDKGNVSIVDVRTKEEYEAQHIVNAILVENETIEKEASSLLPDKDAIILVYCRSGSRSKQASKKLINMGYTNVFDFGGIKDWPYEVQ